MRELEELAAQLERLRERIARCRRGHQRARLPVELWMEAATWARKLGPYRASRALGVSYEALRRKTAASERGEDTPAFVEFSGAQLMEAANGPVVELAGAAGARLTIRLGVGQPLDAAAAVVSAFLRAQR